MLRSPRPQTPAPHPGGRSAFTLIELIVVILVIGILLAMLLPAINNVRIAGRVTQVRADISNLEAAIATFKTKYGMEPPSSFLISPTTADYFETDLTQPYASIGRQSLVIMQQLWPNYSLRSTTPNNGSPGVLMGVGTRTYLNGAECLAFFLGGPGIYTSTGNATDCAPNGFSSNPANPFASGGTRVGPFIEFDASRLVDTNESGSGADGFFELLDTLPNQTAPYQYLSSYGGRGYQPFGYNTSSNLDDEVIAGTLSSAYLKNDARWSTTTPFNPPAASNPAGAWNGKTFQIISPGMDGSYGVGGTFLTDKGIAIGSDSDTYRSRTNRQPEADNITNFHGGMLSNFFTP